MHYCGGGIVPEHWPACKAVLAFHAGESLTKLSSMTKLVKEAAILQLYTSAVAELDEVHFGDSACTFFARSFPKKEETMTEFALYRYYLDSRSKMRNQEACLGESTSCLQISGRKYKHSKKNG